MKKRVAAAGLAAGLAGGAIAGIALTHPSISGAQTETTTPTTAPSANGQAPPDQSSWIEDALAPLVANGTISQSQADDVTKALEAAKPDMHRGPGGPGFGSPGFGRGRELDAAAAAIGISTDDLRTAVQSGQSLAQVAEAHGKTAQDVVAALVAAEKTELDARVKSGDITQAQADQKLAAINNDISAMVNGQMPPRGDWRGKHGDDDSNSGADSSSTSPSTSTA
jgi:hypothetical protein